MYKKNVKPDVQYYAKYSLKVIKMCIFISFTPVECFKLF